jgi:(4S)-4-hydroxy-5-phosphonooxypentane-2,3-dione isomerase
MLVTCVHVEVKPEYIHDFISECKKNHLEAIKEPGNLRFDILQDAENPSVFLLYEAYLDESSSAAHKSTPHYMEWKQAVEHMMEKPRKGIKYQMLYPTNMKS